MNALDLTTFGVEEMNTTQLQEVDGGVWSFGAFVAGAILGGMLYELISDPKGTADAFKTGYDLAWETGRR